MPDKTIRQQILSQARQIVVKVGTSAICDDSGRLDVKTIRGLARQIVKLIKADRRVTLVASGAIGAGLGELDLPERPRTMPELQAVAAVGQGQLMRAFHDVFNRHHIPVAQMLLTREDFEDRTRYLNIRNTLRALGELGALTIINENDVVAVDEIRYGDNDIIAAHVANLLAADVLVFLTTVDGVMDGRVVMDVIREVDDEVLSLVEAHHSHLGSGGMASKITAAGMITRAGEIAIVANARTTNVLTRVLSGKRLGTLFVPATRKLSSRQRWIGQASRPAGKLVVDEGAVQALTEAGKSLLPSGIVSVTGNFKKGATVSIADADGKEIARGLTNYDSEQLGRIKGFRTNQVARILGDKPYDEVIHRNNMTVG
ncbi:MAG: glutamate 5-kinase [Phycisphaerae bacterium]